jgi:hypothetical protein
MISMRMKMKKNKYKTKMLRTKSIWFVTIGMVAILVTISTALLTVYTKIPIGFQVKKSIVVDGELYQNNSYVYPISVGTLYQGENVSKTINVLNNGNTKISVYIECAAVMLVYKSGYKVSKTPENASKDWGIHISVIPNSKVVLPPKSSTAVDIILEIGVNAVTTDSQKYARYNVLIEIRPL